MKIWYRCKCCDKKNIIISQLEIGSAFGQPDTEHERLKKLWPQNWEYLDLFIQCLQAVILKMDGGDNLYAQPDEFGDTVEEWPPWFREKYTAPPRKSKKQKEKEAKNYPLTFGFVMSLDWGNYGALVINDAWFEDKKIGLIEMTFKDEKDEEEKTRTFKHLLKAGNHLVLMYKLITQVSITTQDTSEMDEFDDEPINTMIIKGDFVINKEADDHSHHDHSHHTHEPPPVSTPPPTYEQEETILFMPHRVINTSGSNYEIQADGFKRNKTNQWHSKITFNHSGIGAFLANFLGSHVNQQNFFELTGIISSASGESINFSNVSNIEETQLDFYYGYLL